MTPKEIKTLRNKLGMSQEVFGKAIGGVDGRHVRRYEAGEIAFPLYRMSYIAKLQKQADIA